MMAAVGSGVVAALLSVATVSDLRRRQVPLWLTGGFVVTGVALGVARGSDALWTSALGLLVGVLPGVPFLVLGGLGGADLLLLGGIGAWQGWRFALTAEWWTAMAGAVFALAARRHGARAIPYVPAILAGTILAFVTM
jgi:Flp pilus assembly protein protease CpaA